VLKVLAEHDLIGGKTVGIDATTLEANAAMRSIVRRDSKETYQEFLTRLAKASGIETPTREDLVKIDKGRKNKASNKEWEHPHDPDARIAKMKEGSTHLAHKVEPAVDLGEGASGAVLAITLQGADLGDTATLLPTVGTTVHNLRAVADDRATQDKIAEDGVAEVVTDKGYHSNESLSGKFSHGFLDFAWVIKFICFLGCIWTQAPQHMMDRTCLDDRVHKAL
jgi:transposase